VHLTTAEGLAEVRAFRNRYSRAYIEVCHPHLMFDEDSFTDAIGKIRPPLRARHHREALWDGIRDGSIDTIGSDHVPRPLRDKRGSIWSLTAGVAGTPYLLPVMLSEGLHRRRIPLERLVDLISSRPARLYQMYPRKGSLLVGSDADLTIVDLNEKRTVRASDFPGASDFTPYEGMTLTGWPVRTIVRGRTVMADRQYRESKGWGRYIRR
jgi:dihydropyrimidinase